MQDWLVYGKNSFNREYAAFQMLYASLFLALFPSSPSPSWSSKQPSWLQFNQSLVSSTTWQVNEASFRGGSLPNNQLSIKIEKEDTPNNTRTHTLSSLSFSVCPCESNSLSYFCYVILDHLQMNLNSASV